MRRRRCQSGHTLGGDRVIRALIEDTYGDALPPPQSRVDKSMTQGGVIALNDEKGGKTSLNDTEKCKKNRPAGILEPFWEAIRPKLDERQFLVAKMWEVAFFWGPILEAK